MAAARLYRALTGTLPPGFFQMDFLPMWHGFVLEAAFGECQVSCLTFRDSSTHVATTQFIKDSLQRWPE